MRLTKIIKICRFHNNLLAKSFIKIQCGMYHEGKCDIDGKKCKVVVYKKEIKFDYGIV